MVLRSIKKLRSSGILSKSSNKSISNNADAVIETTFTGTSGQEIALGSIHYASARDVKEEPREEDGAAERVNEGETQECIGDTESRETVNGSIKEERERVESKSIQLHFKRAKPVERPIDAPVEPVAEPVAEEAIQSPRFHANWTKETDPSPQPSIEVSESETEIEVVAVAVHKKEKMPRFRSFMKLGKSKRDVVQEEEVTSDHVEVADSKQMRNGVQNNAGMKASRVQRMGSMKIAVLDTGIVAGCSQSVHSGIGPLVDEVPLTKSTSAKSEKSMPTSANSVESTKTSESKLAQAAPAVKEDEMENVKKSSPEGEASSVFVGIGNVFQRMESYTRSMSRQMSSFAASVGDANAATVDTPVMEEKEDVKLSDEASIQRETSKSAFLEVAEEVKPTADSDVNELEVALNRSTSVDRVQYLAKSITAALELAIEDATMKAGDVCTGEKAVVEATEDNGFEVALEGTPDIRSLADEDNTNDSVKSMAETIFNALELALDGTYAGKYMVFKQQEEETIAVDANCALELDTDTIVTDMIVENPPNDSAIAGNDEQSPSLEEPKSMADNGSKKIVLDRIDESVAADDKSTAELTHASTVNTAKTSVKSVLSNAKSLISAEGTIKTVAVKDDIDADDAQSIATSIGNSKQSVATDLFVRSDVNSTKGEKEEEAQPHQETTEEGKDTMGMALLDSVLYNLAKAEIAAKSEGNTDKQVKIHLLRAKLIRRTNRKDKWAEQLEGACEPDEVFISGPMRRLMTPMLEGIGKTADMIDRAVLDANAACMIGTADLFDQQCMDKPTSDASETNSIDSMVKDQGSC